MRLQFAFCSLRTAGLLWLSAGKAKADREMENRGPQRSGKYIKLQPQPSIAGQPNVHPFSPHSKSHPKIPSLVPHSASSAIRDNSWQTTSPNAPLSTRALHQRLRGKAGKRGKVGEAISYAEPNCIQLQARCKVCIQVSARYLIAALQQQQHEMARNAKRIHI